MNIDGYLTAKREYCTACGILLGSARYLIQSNLTGKFVAVHYDARCLAKFQARNQHDPRLIRDTSSTGAGQ